MRKYDFLFIYETKTRELENVCLLKCELEQRGYSVALVETWRRFHHYSPRISANVVVAFALYGQEQIDFVCHYARDFFQIINLQWEQVYANVDEISKHTIYYMTGAAKYARHIAWGPHNVRWLTQQCGVAADHVAMTGHVAMDFLKPAFHGYYCSKEELCCQYGLDPHKELAIFISSFSYVDLPEKTVQLNKYQQAGMLFEDFQSISALSQHALIEWLKAVLPQHTDVEFVYRPHPAEVGSKAIFELETRMKNLHIVRERSVKQWIVAADRIYTWFSTSVAEVYFSGKRCEILRPLPISYEQDIILYNGCRKIETLAAFDESFHRNADSFPIADAMIADYYWFDANEYSYKRVCALCEEQLLQKAGDKRLLCACRRTIKDVCKELLRPPVFFARRLIGQACAVPAVAARVEKCGQKLRRIAENEVFVERMIRNNYADEAEIAAVEERIRETLLKNGVQL